jgi:hypothetical protein
MVPLVHPASQALGLVLATCASLSVASLAAPPTHAAELRSSFRWW